MTKVDEIYNPSIKSVQTPAGIVFKKADATHIDDIANLMIIRNPSIDPDVLRSNVIREINELNDGVKYGVYVALIGDKLVGFCRFFDSEHTPKSKIRYPHPDGMFFMGILVNPDFRRSGIARFLSEKRFELIKGLGFKCAYSIVDSNNLTSMRLHESLGFKEIERGEGFFTLGFPDNAGILFVKELDK